MIQLWLRGFPLVSSSSATSVNAGVTETELKGLGTFSPYVLIILSAASRVFRWYLGNKFCASYSSCIWSYFFISTSSLYFSLSLVTASLSLGSLPSGTSLACSSIKSMRLVTFHLSLDHSYNSGGSMVLRVTALWPLCTPVMHSPQINQLHWLQKHVTFSFL